VVPDPGKQTVCRRMYTAPIPICSEEGSYLRLIDFLSLNSRLESNKEEDSNLCQACVLSRAIAGVYVEPSEKATPK